MAGQGGPPALLAQDVLARYHRWGCIRVHQMDTTPIKGNAQRAESLRKAIEHVRVVIHTGHVPHGLAQDPWNHAQAFTMHSGVLSSTVHDVVPARVSVASGDARSLRPDSGVGGSFHRTFDAADLVLATQLPEALRCCLNRPGCSGDLST